MHISKILFLLFVCLVLFGIVFAFDGFHEADKQIKEKPKIAGEDVKQKAEKVKEDIKEKVEKFKVEKKLEQYEEKKKEWEKEKQKHLALGAMLESNKGRAITVEYLQQLELKIKEHLETLCDKNHPFAQYFKLKTDEINEVITKLDENSTKEEILDAIKKIKKIWSDSEHKRKLIIGIKFVNRLEKVIPKMETALNKLDSKIGAVEEVGVDTNAARKAYDLAQTSLTDLKSELVKSKEDLNTLLSKDKIDVKEVNMILKAIKTKVQDTRNHLVKTWVEYNKVKNSAKEEKELESKKELEDKNKEGLK